jgi:hypothetical protein
MPVSTLASLLALLAVLAWILALLLGSAGPATAQPRMVAPDRAADDSPIRLADLMAMMAAVPERRAVFHEEKRFAALAVPLESSGHLLFRRPGHLEKITDAPQAESLVVDGRQVSLTEADGRTHVIDLGTQPELRSLVDAMRGPLAGDGAALERGFKISLTGTRAAWRLDLTPSDPRAARLVTAVHITGSGSDMREVLVVQANGDTQDMSIEP